MQIDQNIVIALGYWVVEASALALWHDRVFLGGRVLFSSLHGILESTDFIPESSQNAKTYGDYSKMTVMFYLEAF